jgi:hypothetical protein
VRLGAAIAAALVLSGSAASADGREPRHCARSGVRDVAADVRGRIYGSLALSPDGRHVYWTKDGNARIAAL